jgi:hypothetical protein
MDDEMLGFSHHQGFGCPTSLDTIYYTISKGFLMHSKKNKSGMD